MENFKYKSVEELSAMTADEQSNYIATKQAFEKKEIENMKSEIKAADKTAEIELLKSKLIETEQRIENLDKMVIDAKKAQTEKTEAKTRKSIKSGVLGLVNRLFSEQIKSNGGDRINNGLKATSVTSNYTDAPSQDSMLVRDDYPVREASIVDLIPQMMDVERTSIEAPVVESWTMPSTSATENSEAAEASFQFSTQPFNMVRRAVFVALSKRFLYNGLRWIANWVGLRLPAKLQLQIDYYLIGQIKAGARKFADFANLTITAGDIASQADFGGYTKLTFGAAHTITMPGGIITWSAGLSGTNQVVSIESDTVIVIDKAYIAAATTTWAGVMVYPMKASMVEPDQYGVITGAIAMLQTNEYMVSGVVFNPQDLALLRTQKSAVDEHYITGGYTSDLPSTIGGVAFAVSNGVPTGYVLLGDFQRGAMLHWGRNITVEQSEDTDDKKKNQITYIADAEFIFEFTNPKWFIYDTFANGVAYFAK